MHSSLKSYLLLLDAGLFEWSMSYQDGTAPTGSSNARQLSESDRQWYVLHSFPSLLLFLQIIPLFPISLLYRI